MSTARGVARTVAEVVAITGGAAAAGRIINRRGIAILAYHNVVSAGNAGRGDASLHLPLPQFIAQIERLAKTHEIVDLDTVANESDSRRPRAVITFDDAYRGAVMLALPELVRRRIPAVMFVAPGMLGARSTWWDDLAAAGSLSTVQRDAMLTGMAGRKDLIMSSVFRGSIPPSLPEDYGIATREELIAACGSVISVGSHSWGHEFLPALDPDTLTASLSDARDWLLEFPGRRSEWIALPYGGGSNAVTHTAVSLGHRGVLRISGGMWKGPFDAEVAPRINVPAGMSTRGLELRASGIFPR